MAAYSVTLMTPDLYNRVASWASFSFCESEGKPLGDGAKPLGEDDRESEGEGEVREVDRTGIPSACKITLLDAI
jgi:hypothetical protein